MQEILPLAAAERLMLLMALALPLLGAAVALAGKRRGLGLAIGVAGPANYALWRIYNAITNRFGLDTMANLYINLALFVALGLVVGWVAGRLSAAKKVS